MSYWVYLVDGGESVSVERHAEGGTYALGGITQAALNVTYNYGAHIRQAGLKDGLKTLHGMSAKDSIPPLEVAVAKLGKDRDPDYWKDTPGNAGFALSILLAWAKEHPTATWEVH
jgi:hypothetical protein